MTSSNGNIFRATGHLCGEFTGPRWISHAKASDAELWCFLSICVWINGWVNNRKAGDLRRYRVHCDVIVMKCWIILILSFYTHAGTKLSSLATPKFVILTIFGAASGENFVEIIFPFSVQVPKYWHSTPLHWRHMNTIAAQITRKSTVCSTACSVWRAPCKITKISQIATVLWPRPRVIRHYTQCDFYRWKKPGAGFNIRAN